MTVRVNLLHLIYVRGALKLPAGAMEMRQAASIQGDPGRSPVSACRPRPWWTCSHGEVIHDVTAVSCRWRTDRGPERAWVPFFLCLSLFSCTCSLSNQRAQSWLAQATVWKKKKSIFIAVRFAVWLNVYTVVGRLFRLDGSQLVAAGQNVMFCFFPGILKWRWCLISFWFISTLLMQTEKLVHWNLKC